MKKPEEESRVYLDGEKVFEYLEEKCGRKDIRSRWLEELCVRNDSYSWFPDFYTFIEAIEYRDDQEEAREMEKDIQAFYTEWPEYFTSGVELSFGW